jgi:D-beta-D-heptose 7-phosphate kinase/D-beta-D-heptose 1-phosphate adenosyltransferase
MPPEESRRLASRFAERSVLVIGDVMLDQYLWGDAGRISPEAPVPVVDVVEESFRLGGAANVARNVVSLGGQVELLSVVGRDPRADDLRSLLEDESIPTEGLIEDPDRPTTLKTRILASRQQVVRVDRESRAPLEAEVRERFVERLRARLDAVDAVIVSDYGKGVVDLDLMGTIAGTAREKGVIVAVDPKDAHFYQYRNVSVVTPNVHEASRCVRHTIRDLDSLEEAGRKLLGDLESDALLITRGPDGMSLFEPGVPTSHIPVMAREVYDVTGAGDTVIAALTLARAAGASWVHASVLSNAAAAVVVSEVGTASVSADQLGRALEVGFPMENAT